MSASVCPRCGHELEEDKYCPACRWPLSAAPAAGDDLVGQLFEQRYHVLRRLGQGGMAEVYLVEHIRMGKRMAMKVLRPQAVPDDQESWVRKRFTAEARAVSRLTSVHTTAVFDFGTLKDGMLYLVMEFVRGESLRDHLNRSGVFDELVAAQIGEQVLDSLGEAHRRGIVHRDIKPDNVMMLESTEGTLLTKVLDFGVARTLRGDLAITAALEEEERGLVVGTPDYVSPEQAKGESVGPASDLYSLGSTLFELVTGRVPYPEQDANDILVAIIEATTPPVPVRPDGSPVEPGFAAILARSMAYQEVDRYPDAATMRAELREYVRSLGLEEAVVVETPRPGTAPAVPPATRPATSVVAPDDPDVAAEDLATREDFEAFERSVRRLGRRNHVSLAVLACLTLAVAGVLYWQYGWNPVRPPPAEAHEQEPNNRPSEANHLAYPGKLTGLLGKRESRELADRDWVRFELTERQVTRLAVTPIPNLDLELAVYPGEPDAAGQHHVLAVVNDRERGEGEVLPNLTLDPGPYYVRITEHRPPDEEYYPTENVSDAYKLTVEGRHQAVDEEVEPNDGRDRASPLALGGTVRGLAVCADDRDWFAIDLGSPGKRIVDLAISGLTGAPRELVVYGDGERPLYRFDLAGRNEYRRNRLKLGRRPISRVFIEVLGPPAGGAAERWYELSVR